mmetsp:Transcript_33793/g.105151  ORF Transcript_33793/g.105151 Transcript_33793/m.105151 type:complete len:211 (-) Transcript_33793:546-1178(-)
MGEARVAVVGRRGRGRRAAAAGVAAAVVPPLLAPAVHPTLPAAMPHGGRRRRRHAHPGSGARGTAAAMLLAAVGLLAHGPASLPVGEAGAAIVVQRGRRRHLCCIHHRAAKAHVRAAEGLLLQGPAALPVHLALAAVVGLARGRGRERRGRAGRAAKALVLAAPSPLRRRPGRRWCQCSFPVVLRPRPVSSVPVGWRRGLQCQRASERGH